MKIYDCFGFNDENHLLELRLNELNEYIGLYNCRIWRNSSRK